MTDQLEDLFRDLRTETLTTVRPPGATAARQALRRRRRNRRAGAAACLAVAGVGGLGAHLFGPAPEPDVGDRPEHAASAVGPAPDARFSGQGAAMSAVLAAGVVLEGRYNLALSCVGRGRVTLTIRVGGAPIGQAAARCDGRVQRTVFSLADTLTATAELTAEDGAAGQAGYAYAMTLMAVDRERLTADAVGALPTARGTVVSRWDGPVAGRMTDATTLDAGSYLLVYECAGTGQIAITVRTAARTESIGESCDRYPRPRDTTVDLRTRGDLMVEITPDAEADRQAAYAVRLERR